MANLPFLLKITKSLRGKKPDASPSMAILGAIIIGALLIAGVIIYTGWKTIAGPALSEILPAEKTTFFIEFENFDLPPSLSEKPVSQALSLGSLTRLFGMEDLKAFPKGFKKNAALAFLKDGSEVKLLFLEVNSRRQAKKYLESLALPNEKIQKKTTASGLTFYTYPGGRNLFAAFFGSWMVLSESEEALIVVHEVNQKKIPSLATQPDYQKAFSNLARSAWAQGYINLKKVSFNSPTTSFLKSLQPLTESFSFTLRKEENGFHLNTFVAMNPEWIPLNRQTLDSTPLSYDLTKWIPAENLSTYFGGANLAAEWQNTLTTLSQVNPAYGLILEGMAQAQVKKYFSDGIDLRNDLYPLFEGEYAASLFLSEKEPFGFLIILGHEDKVFAEAKLKKLAENFKTRAAQFAPEIRIVALPDGTESRELIAEPDNVKETSEKAEGQDIFCIEVPASPAGRKKSVYGFCYALMDNVMIASNSLPTLKASLKAGQSGSEALTEDHSFRQALSRLSKISDEITHINPGSLKSLLQKNMTLSLLIPYLEGLESITYVKHYFDDGVSTEGFILIK